MPATTCVPVGIAPPRPSVTWSAACRCRWNCHRQASSGGGSGRTLSAGTVGGGKVNIKIAESGCGQHHPQGQDGKSPPHRSSYVACDRYAGKFNSQYQRALRSSPALQGTFVLYLVIAPSGEVQDVKVKSSQLGDSQLERRIMLIAKGMNSVP